MRGLQVAPRGEQEVNGRAMLVDGAVEIPPLPTDLDIGFINMPFAGNGSFAPIEPLQQFGRVPDDPPVDRGVIDGDTPLRHHLLKISETEIIGQIPPDAEQDHRSIKMPAFEHHVPHYCDRGPSS